jgi:hypothetical protein
MTTDGLSLAQDLLAAGVPVVVVRPSIRVELLPPRGWNTVTAQECDLSRFRPDVDTLAMVSGHGIDVLDIDAKEGGHPSFLPPVLSYGRHRTPSGGWHVFVSSTGHRKISPWHYRGKPIGDYAGGAPEGRGRLLVYLPGSTRPKYPGLDYEVEEPLDIARALEGEPDPLLLDVLEESSPKPKEFKPRPGHVASLEPKCAHVLASRSGGRNAALNRAAYWAGLDGLDPTQSRAALVAMATTVGLGHAEALATFDSGYAAGIGHRA